MLVTSEKNSNTFFNFNKVIQEFDLQSLLEAQSYIGSLVASSEAWRFSRSFDHMDYVSPLNPLYVYGVSDIAEIVENWSSLFIRDGLLGVLYFFSKFPTPALSELKVFVHENFSSVVPDEWRGQTLLYRHCVGPRPLMLKDNSIRKKLLLKMDFDSLYWNKNAIEKLPKVLNRIFEVSGTFSEIHLLSTSSQIDFKDKESSLFFELVTILNRNIPEFSFLNWHKLQTLQNMNEFEFVDLSSAKLILSADSYIDLFLCSKGARPNKTLFHMKMADNFIPFAPGLGISLSSFAEANFERSDLLKEMNDHDIKPSLKEGYEFLNANFPPMEKKWGSL